MSVSQRRKGAAGEREAHKVLWEQLGDIVEERDLSQTRDGGGDLRIPSARVVVEVKRSEARAVPTWLRQAEASARAQGEGWAAAVMWRRNRDLTWAIFRVLPPDMRAHGQSSYGYETMEVAEFCDWVRGRLG